MGSWLLVVALKIVGGAAGGTVFFSEVPFLAFGCIHSWVLIVFTSNIQSSSSGTRIFVNAASAMTDILVDAFKLGTNDLGLLAGAPLLLATVAMLACYLPARRVAQIDPLKASREE